jgi:predicted ribonuclease YlaK
MLTVYEFDSSVQPGAKANHFEVYDKDDVVTPIFVSEELDKVARFCYDSGQNFTIYTAQAYYNEFGE